MQRKTIDLWLKERHPLELRQLIVEHRLSENEIEYGFAKAIEMGLPDWIGEFSTSFNCNLNRFSGAPVIHCPLTYAILNSEPSTAEKLLILGADPNILVASEVYHRPLHIAVDLESTGQLYLPNGEIPAPFTELLVAYGADPLLLDARGLSALEFASREGHKAAWRVLVKAAEDEQLKERGMLSFARRLTLTAGRTLACAQRQDLHDLDFLRALVVIAAESNSAEWIDDDLARLGLWLLHLGALADAEETTRRISPGHPGKARLLIRIAEKRALKDSGSHWRDLLDLALNAVSSTATARSRADTLVRAASLLARKGDTSEARKQLIVARNILVNSPSDPGRDQGLSAVAAQLNLIGSHFEAYKTTRAIDNWKLRWETRRGKHGSDKPKE